MHQIVPQDPGAVGQKNTRCVIVLIILPIATSIAAAMDGKHIYLLTICLTGWNRCSVNKYQNCAANTRNVFIVVNQTHFTTYNSFQNPFNPLFHFPRLKSLHHHKNSFFSDIVFSAGWQLKWQ